MRLDFFRSKNKTIVLKFNKKFIRGHVNIFVTVRCLSHVASLTVVHSACLSFGFWRYQTKSGPYKFHFLPPQHFFHSSLHSAALLLKIRITSTTTLLNFSTALYWMTVQHGVLSCVVVLANRQADGLTVTERKTSGIDVWVCFTWLTERVTSTRGTENDSPENYGPNGTVWK